MTLQASGPISVADINIELGRPSNTQISFNDPEVRTLAEKPNGTISLSDFHGKSTVMAGGTITTGYGLFTVNNADLIGWGASTTTSEATAPFGSASATPLIVNSGGAKLWSLYWNDSHGAYLAYISNTGGANISFEVDSEIILCDTAIYVGNDQNGIPMYKYNVTGMPVFFRTNGKISTVSF